LEIVPTDVKLNNKIMACCKSCARVGRKKTNMAKFDVMKGVGTGARVAAGIAIGKVVANKIPALQTNPLLGAAAQLGLALVVAGTGKGKKILQRDLAAGMAANAMVSFLNATAPDVTSQLGISGIGQPFALDSGSNVMPGVAGGTVGRYNSPVTYAY
jgi:hypothetical protein